MIIESVRFVNCTRFKLGGHSNLIVRPKALLQMIIGTNGAGKSSFADLAFSPLTPSHHDFGENGAWEWICNMDGSRYALAAEFDKKRYSFLKDGVELNPGKTITVQNQLVEEHFRYDRLLHDILTGNAKFTSMSPQQRSNAISKISNVDFSYAFSKFNEWRKGYNSSSSVVKFLSGRLAEEQEKLISDEDKKVLRENVSRLSAQLETIRQLDRPVDYKQHLDGGESINQLINEFHQYADEFLKAELPVVEGKSKEEVLSLSTALATRLSDSSKSLEEIGERLSKAESRKERVLKSLVQSDITSLEAEVKKAEDMLNSIPTKNIDIPDEWLIRCDDIIAGLTYSLSALSPSLLQDKEEFKTVTVQMNNSILELNKAKHLLENLSQKMIELTSEKEISCPSCSFVFRPGVNHSDITGLQQRLLQGESFVTSLDDKNRTIQDRYNELYEVNNAYDTLLQLRETNYERAKGLFTYIDSLGGFSKGRSLINNLAIYSKEVEYRERRQMIIRGLEHNRVALESSKGANESKDKIIEEYTTIETEYSHAWKIVDDYRKKRKSFDKSSSYLEQYEFLYERAMSAHEAIKAEVILTLGGIYRKVLNDEVERLQTGLAINANALSDNDVIETIIKDLSKQLSKAKTEMSAHKLLMDAMDPKTGLIAEQIRVQIGTIVNGMNNMIASVWNYPLTLDLPSEEEGKLNYKFPMWVDGTFRDDISKGSSSMKAIVNTTFSILAHYSFGLSGYPVYLDEFDGTFDGVHSDNVIKLVKDLADSGRFNHVIIISHNEKIQKAFPTAEVLILDERNLDDSPLTNLHKVR